MKKRIIIASVVLVTLLTATVIQYWILPTAVWSSTATLQFSKGYVYLVQQGHLIEDQDAPIDILVRRHEVAANDVIQKLSADDVKLDSSYASSYQAIVGRMIDETTWDVTVPVPAADAGHHALSVRLHPETKAFDTAADVLQVPIDVSPSRFHRFWFTLLIFAFFLPFEAALLGFVYGRGKGRSLEDEIEKAEKNVENEPTKAKPAWDLARVKLEAYFDRNLFQINQVFWLAVVMMMVGFGFVLAAVVMSLNHTDVIPASKVAALSGIITQFIGATFLVIYRSTMAQANEFMSVLERINTVGMAVQVLDSIPDKSDVLKDKTRAEIVALLLSANVPKKSRTEKP